MYYHQRCYLDYTRKSTLVKLKNSTVATHTPSENVVSATCIQSDPAVSEVFQFVRSSVLSAKRTVTIKHLTTIYTTVHHTSAIMRPDKMKNALIKEFGEELVFCRPSHRNLPEVVCAAEHLHTLVADLHYRAADSNTCESDCELVMGSESNRGDEDSGDGGSGDEHNISCSRHDNDDDADDGGPAGDCDDGDGSIDPCNDMDLGLDVSSDDFSSVDHSEDSASDDGSTSLSSSTCESAYEEGEEEREVVVMSKGEASHARRSARRPQCDTELKFTTADVRTVYHAARTLRIHCLEHGRPLSLATSQRLSFNSALKSVPPLLHNFLVWLITDSHHDDISSSCITTDDAVERNVCSIGQDLMFATTNAVPPKHVVLALTVHHLFRSKKLITILNRYGHCIAYPQVAEWETTMASKNVRDGVCMEDVPPSIDSARPFFHVVDNNDLNEETRDGKGTMHCTNTIIVQPNSVAVTADRPLSLVRSAKRKRSLSLLPESVPDSLRVMKTNPRPISALSDCPLDVCPSDNSQAKLHDFVWVLARSSEDGSIFKPSVSETDSSVMQHEQSVPGWTAFNALASKGNIPAQSTIAYCPVVNASPTEISTVYAVLSKCHVRCSRAGLPYTIVVADQAIYAKALEVVLQRPAELKNVVLRLGAFHTASTFISIIGKRFKDAGLFDILVESGVGGAAAVTSALNGRQYNRAVRFIKVVYEGLERLRWCEFAETVDNSNSSLELHTLTSAMKELQACITDDNLVVVESSPILHDLYRRYAKFCDERCRKFPNFNFWSSFLDMALLLLRFIRASRVGDWNLHLSCILQMLPWCFSYDRLNYARYLTLYWLQMTNLGNTHPEALAFLKNGGLSVQRSTCPFAMVAADMAIEQSINRPTKTQGGIIGFSRDPSAVQRWVLTSHERAEVADTCLEHCGLDAKSEEGNRFHKECHTTRMIADEKDVSRILSAVSSFVNPFTTAADYADTKLVSLSSCVEASDSATNDLLKAEERGTMLFQAFVRDRLTADPPVTKFHDPMKKMNLETFTPKKPKSGSGRLHREASLLRTDYSVFSRIALIAQTREMDLREVLSYPLGPYPWSLATLSGSLMKTSKAALLHLLKTDTPAPASTASSSALLLGEFCSVRFLVSVACSLTIVILVFCIALFRHML